MRRKTLAALTALIVTAIFSAAAQANDTGKEDTDIRFVKAKVVEVAERHISVIARSGVEHVIAVDGASTRVLIGDKQVRPADLKVGDIVTVELDAESRLKFARHISVDAHGGRTLAKLDN